MAGTQSFLAGFLNSAGASLQRKKQEAQLSEFKKLQTKILNGQLAAAETKLKYQDQLESMMAPSNAPLEGMEGPPAAARPGMTVSQIMADPQGQLAMLMSGTGTLKDIGLESERQRWGQFAQSLQSGQGKGKMDLGFTPESQRIFAQSRDVNDLKPIQPEKVMRQMPDNTVHNVLVNPYTEEVVADLGLAKEEKMAPEAAGRITGLRVGQEKIQKWISGVVNPDGSINRKNVINMNVEGPIIGKGMPFTTGRKLRSDFETIADGIIRARTGAGMNTQEVTNFLDENLPSSLDDDATIKSKIAKIESFLNGSLDLITLPDRIRKLWEAQKAKELRTPAAQRTGAQPSAAQPAVTSQPNVVNFEDLP